VLTGAKETRAATDIVVPRRGLMRIRDLRRKPTDIIYIDKKERLNRP
jgi:hypothetical protein